MTTQTTPQKSSIKQQLRTDLGQSVGVTTTGVINLVYGPNLYRLHVIYSDKVLFLMFINVKCLL